MHVHCVYTSQTAHIRAWQFLFVKPQRPISTSDQLFCQFKGVSIRKIHKVVTKICISQTHKITPKKLVCDLTRLWCSHVLKNAMVDYLYYGLFFLSDKIIELYEVLEDMRVKHAQKLQSNAYRSFKVTQPYQHSTSRVRVSLTHISVLFKTLLCPFWSYHHGDPVDAAPQTGPYGY